MESSEDSSVDKNMDSSATNTLQKIADDRKLCIKNDDQEDGKLESNSEVLDNFKAPSLPISLKKAKTAGKNKLVSHVEDKATVPENSSEDNNLKSNQSAGVPGHTVPLPYKEPRWSGAPTASYSFEVLKSGKILETINLSNKPFYVMGRITSCDIILAHPTISRYHAVIQYKDVADSDKARGFYVYDLGSTHGTFLNKYKVQPKTYVRIHVGHMLKLGCSTRMFILQGPDCDAEPESELTVTELKEKRKQIEMGKNTEDDDESGVNWGMGSDAEEENDLEENPYASTNNEELYIDDPKKALRDWFSREGYDLEYQVEEKGYSQFLCKVDLPVDAAPGGSITAEAFVKGKKKESVVQCALEACRILDRYNLLHQPQQESKKRKAKNWEDDDFYDSDEDNFYDRTGTVDEKRKRRMAAAGKLTTEVDTFETLTKKHEVILAGISDIEKKLSEIENSVKSSGDNEEEDDPLDSYMRSMSSEASDRRKLKSELAKMKAEEARLKNLLNIAKPATINLPKSSTL